MKNITVGVKDLMIQLLVAHGYNEVMWFQISLIAITFIMVGVSKLTGGGEKENIVLSAIFWACIIGQYSGTNGKIWGRFLIPVWGSYGRICEVLPVVVVAVLFQKYGILRELRKHWKSVMVGIGLAILAVYRYAIFTEINGYAYSGFWRPTMAIMIIVFFFCLPFNEIKKGREGLIIISKATPGVYYMQRMLLTLFIRGRSGILVCFLLFLSALSISVLAGYFSKSRYLKYLFL